MKSKTNILVTLLLVSFIWLIGCASFGAQNIKFAKRANQAQEELSTMAQKFEDVNNKYINTQNELLSAKEELESIKTQLQSAEDALSQSQDQLQQQSDEIDALNKTIEELNELLLNDNELPDLSITESDVYLIVNTVWGEAGICSKIEQSAIIWCILNRVDAGYGTIKEVITAPGQFHGYKEWLSPDEIDAYDELRDLTIDVLLRWQMEKRGCNDVGRTLPKDYLWFYGDGQRNYFRNAFSGDYDIWDWGCWNPYE